MKLIAFLALVSCVLVVSCRSTYSGQLITEYDAAKLVVDGYQEGVLEEEAFLSEWPHLMEDRGDKRLWVWGILEASRGAGGDAARNDYWIGYFSSSEITSVNTPPVFYPDTLGSGDRFDLEVQRSRHAVSNKIWRVTFDDGKLAGKEQLEAR